MSVPTAGLVVTALGVAIPEVLTLLNNAEQIIGYGTTAAELLKNAKQWRDENPEVERLVEKALQAVRGTVKKAYRRSRKRRRIF